MDYPNHSTRFFRSSTKAAQHICLSIFVFIMLLLWLQPMAIANPLSSTPLLPMPQTTPAAPPSAGDAALAVSTSAGWSSDDADFTQSVAWGDVDNDGDLDLAVGNGVAPNKVYLNEGGVLTSVAAWSSDESNNTRSVAWGDVDNDGDLDLAVGNDGAPNKVYLNEGGVLSTVAAWSSDESDSTQSVVWGDVDNDGDLDLAVGNDGTPNKVYLNEGGVLSAVAAWSSDESDSTYSVAWGDVDNDNDLDLAVGNYGEPNKVYLNEGGVLTSVATWSSDESDNTYSVAWGDVDNDGNLDLAVGNGNLEDGEGETNKVYLNEGGALNTVVAWSSDESNNTRSVAWGDVDNDGDLDLAVGNWIGSNKIYLNEGGVLSAVAAWSSGQLEFTVSMAWGDVDNDGDLDLAAGNSSRRNNVYLNEGDVLSTVAAWSSDESNHTRSVAWGDVDNDGDLDLAVGNSGIEDGGAPNMVYLNEGGVLSAVAAWSSDDADWTESVAWGDVDNDGDLDLAVGNGNASFEIETDGGLSGAPNKVYLNEGGVLSAVAAWSSGDADDTHSVAWGDVDNDGDLDLAVGNHDEFGAPNKVYLNEGGVLSAVAAWSSDDDDFTNSVAWGDVDNDGDLDLTAGNSLDPNKVYLNEGGVLSAAAAWSSDDADWSFSVAWGDVDSDGNLDLAVGNSANASNNVYLNEGGVLTSVAAWSSAQSDWTSSVALADMDNDGDLDLTVGNFGAPNKVYLNEGGMLTSVNALPSDDADWTESVAWGDVDNDGDLDLAVGNWDGQNKVYLNRVFSPAVVGQAPSIAIDLTGQLPLTDFYGTPTIEQNGFITIPYTISVSQAQPVRAVRAQYSLNGGGDWQEAAGLSKLTEPSGQPQIDGTYLWDVYASGFFGQSDNVVVRLMAHLACTNSCQRASVATQTLPLRVRGTQVWVGHRDNDSQPLPDARIYLLPKEQPKGASPIMAPNGTAFRTDAQGYLQGRSQLAEGDQLIALAPIMATAKYTLYHTSAQPIRTGLDLTDSTVGELGVQELLASADHPLLLFNLDISLEWDASADSLYLEQLSTDLRRTAELLYDWTNGQASLGTVTVYHAKAQWETADIHIHATNRLRPHATIGGVVRYVMVDTFTKAGESAATKHLYAPGHVEMGATWNRYGEPGEQLSEDWPRTLTHELGHYLFFLHDNYVGLDDNNNIVRIESCLGVMSDPYGDTNSEFHPQENWLPACQQTFSQRKLARDDWATIKAHYPWLHGPTVLIDDPSIDGPNVLPLAVTNIRFVAPEEAGNPVAVPTFSLAKNDGLRYLPTTHARAFLFQGNRLVDLGTPTGDRVEARNASPGDSLCVYDLAAKDSDGLSTPVTGCVSIQSGEEQLTLETSPDGWQPDVIISPTTAQKLVVSVTNFTSPDLVLIAKLYPKDSQAATTTTLTYQDDTQGYTGIIDLPSPAYSAYLHIYEEGNPSRGVVADYTLGGAPALVIGDGDLLQFSTGTTLTRANGEVLTLGNGDELVLRNGQAIIEFSDGDALYLGDGDALYLGDGDALYLGDGDALYLGDGDALYLGDGDALYLGDGDALYLGDGDALYLGDGDASVRSSDGQMTLYGETLEFQQGQFYNLQPATAISNLPVWTTTVGDAYRVTASPDAPSLNGLSISMNYIGRDVADEKEELLTIYYWDTNLPVEERQWQALTTLVDDEHNIATAKAKGVGIYALMYSLDIPLTGQGWDFFSYPVLGSRTVTRALASIEPYYSIVYHHDRFQTDLDQQWTVYAPPPVPSWVNSLTHLEFGQTYWISATHTTSITLQLADSEPSQVRAAATTFTPPATYYGYFQPSASLEPAAGMNIEAWIGNTLCGTGETRAVDDQIGFVVIVRADGGGQNAGCGKSDQTVRFEVDGQALFPTRLWDDGHVTELSLTMEEEQPSGGGSVPEVEEDIKNSSFYLPLIMEP